MEAPLILDKEQFHSILHHYSPPDGWEIRSSKSYDIIWNIVLAYLNSLSNEDGLVVKTEYFFGKARKREQLKIIEDCIEVCNPFLYRNTCFNHKKMSKLIDAFKDRVKTKIKNYDKLSRNPEKNLKCLEASAQLLFCKIVLITFSVRDEMDGGKVVLTVFPDLTPWNPKNMDTKHLLILNKLTEENKKIKANFSFCIFKDIGLQKQKLALKEILIRTRISDNRKQMEQIQQVIDLQGVTENFLLFVLKNDYGKILPFIFESRFVILKLADAGFQTDPRTKDSDGKSAFYYALKAGESHLVTLLYEHAANACLLTDASVRSPDSDIVENLLCLQNYLESMKTDLESSKINSESRYLLEDLCQFNKFQIEICKEVLNISYQTNSTNSKRKRVMETKVRKERLLTILKNYNSYFNYSISDSTSDRDIVSQIQDFCDHSYYYDKLDLSLALMFFDNLFFLKEGLVLSDNGYRDIESQFCLFMFFKKNIEQYVKYVRFEYGYYYILSWIRYQERLALQSELCNFEKNLKNTEPTENNIIDRIPDDAVLTLTNVPEIYDHVFILRWQDYLNAAISLKVTDVKSILIIERCLHVLGECLKESNFNSIQRILISVLPKDLKKHLKNIRDTLSHMDIHQLLYRHNLQQDIQLFEGIKKELSKLKEFLHPIYSLHKHEIDNFVVSHFLESAQNGSEIIIEEMEKAECPIKKFSHQHFLEIKTNFEKKKSYLNHDVNILVKKTRGHYKSVIQNMLSVIEELVNSTKTTFSKNVADLKMAIEKIDSHFWCFEKMLTYLTKDSNLAVEREKLPRMLEDRESIFTKLKETIKELQKKSKPAVSENLGVYGKYGVICEINTNVTSQGDGLEPNIYNDYNANDENKDSEKIIIAKIESILNNYKELADRIFQFPSISNRDLDFKNIKKYCMILQGYKILNEKEKKDILESVPKKFKKVTELKQIAKDLLKGDTKWTKELETVISKLKLKNKDVKEIRENMKQNLIKESYSIIDKVADFFSELNEALESNAIDKRKYESLCKELEIPEYAKNVLSTIVRGQNKKIPGNPSEFFQNRIQLLKNLLTDEYDFIRQLWERASTRREKMCVKEKIVQLYLKDSKFKASIEMLLFDCMTILDHKALKNLWKKTEKLLKGINLRNILAHGHPLLEFLGRLLDPDDLPSQLVEKVLMLISDQNNFILNCIKDVQELSERNDTSISYTLNLKRFQNLREIMASNEFWTHFASAPYVCGDRRF